MTGSAALRFGVSVFGAGPQLRKTLDSAPYHAYHALQSVGFFQAGILE